MGIIRFYLIFFIGLGSVAHAGVYSGSGLVSSVSTAWEGTGFVFTVPGTNNGCTNSTSYFIPNSSTTYKDIVATIVIGVSY